MSHRWRTTQADYDPLHPRSTYTELAKECRHTIYHDTAATLTFHLPASTYNPLTNNPTTFTGISATKLLCPTCESAMYAELAGSRRAYFELWDADLTIDEEDVYAKAIRRFKRALLRVANFEAEREVVGGKWNWEVKQRVEERGRRWEAGRRVRFAVGEGEGGGSERGEGEEAGCCAWVSLIGFCSA